MSVTDNYKEIPTTKFEVSQPDPKEQDEIVEITLDELIVDNVEEPKDEPTEEIEPKEEEQSTKKPVKPKDAKRTSRAQKRIQQLNTAKNDLAQQLEDQAAKYAKLEAKYNEGNVQSNVNLKDSLTNNLKSVTQQMSEAMKDGDTELTVELQDQMMDMKMSIAGLDAEMHRTTETTQTQQKPTPPTTNIPEKALDWIEDNPSFKTDQTFHDMSISVSRQLINEGFSDTSEDFYEELDSRLAPRFPELFGTEGENSVKYEDNTNSSDEEDVNNLQSNDESVTKVEQTVSGASRSPTKKSSKSKRGKDSVVLSPQDVAQAERWGFTLEQMARRVAHNEKNRDHNGYVPIKMK